ncbi:lipopolysaccharide cholinephosphotransferase [Enterococcus sp. DIV0840]|uniref:LicD family protein n=1 Tax=Enterococcus TaxID=1350 RepID=UPI001A8C4F40|nr:MULTISPECIES: LicD family protein [Enterococcus]MBO0434083.1 LicD family protein [Enterococcus sp. DIV0849a]MBO0472988.1 LicD family protein [Enterococcus ureasiticus]
MTNVKKIQEIDLDNLNTLLEVFEKHNLRYYMLGGTFLGAIRHKGFIPWDDDIDIGLPREDYEKFCKEYYKELPSYLIIENYKTNPEYRYYITRVLDTRTKVIELRNKNIQDYTYIAIDIFPLDGMPNNRFVRQFFVYKILFHKMLISLSYIDTVDKKRKRNFFEKILIKFGEKVKFSKLIKPYKEKEKIDRLLKKNSFENSTYISNIMGAYREKEVMPKEIFQEGNNYLFEEIQLNGPINYDEYLKRLYGDYMKIPSEHEIESKNHYELLSGDEE